MLSPYRMGKSSWERVYDSILGNVIAIRKSAGVRLGHSTHQMTRSSNSIRAEKFAPGRRRIIVRPVMA